MRLAARPGLLLRRRVTEFERRLPAAVAGDVEGIHQARVASRRLRELLPLLAAAAGDHATRSLRRDVRAITRHLGPLREVDVALATLIDLETTAPDHAAAIAVVRARAAIDRDRLAPRVARALTRAQTDHLVRHVRDVADRLDSPTERARCAALAAVRLETRIARLGEAVAAVGVVYAAGPLHQVRIALKKFRYALEIAADLGHFRLDASLAHLKSLQDLLGTMHDLQIAAGRVRDAEAAPARAAGARRQLRALADELDERVRQLHSRYLDERAAIVPVVSRARRAAAALGLMHGDWQRRP